MSDKHNPVKKPKVQYFSYDPEDGSELHDTEDEARRAVESYLDYARDRSAEGWPEDMEEAGWGVFLAFVRETPGSRKTAEDMAADEWLEGEEAAEYVRRSEFDYVCDYEIGPVMSPLDVAHAQIAALRDENAALRAEVERLRAAAKGTP